MTSTSFVEATRARSEEPLVDGFDTATRHDPEFNALFEHRFTTIDGVQMHYVVGGSGPQVMVLLHGWPESWFEYRPILPALLPGRTVIAIDLPGLGDSSGTPTSMAKSLLATYVHKLLDHLGARTDVQVVAHDFGVGIAYPLAAQYRDQISGLFLMDYGLLGRNLKFAAIEGMYWHSSFNKLRPLAEQLVEGRVEVFLRYFFDTMRIGSKSNVSEVELAEFVRVYSREQVLVAGFELYRFETQEEDDNTEFQKTPLTVPVRMITQDGLAELVLPPLQDAAPHATSAHISGVGHFLVHEAPEVVLAEINAFYPVTDAS